MALEPGLRSEVIRTVGPEHTAEALGSGDVPVLATPQVLAWSEGVSMQLAAAHLPAGDTTVGMRARLDHAAPTPVGGEVTIACVLGAVDGRRLTFDIEVTDATGQVCASGQIIRVVVDRSRFLARV